MEQKLKIDQKTYIENLYLNQKFGDKYIDLLSYMKDQNEEIPVFFNTKFISSDCVHLTKDGAIYISNILNNKITNIILERHKFEANNIIN